MHRHSSNVSKVRGDILQKNCYNLLRILRRLRPFKQLSLGVPNKMSPSLVCLFRAIDLCT